MEQIALVLLVSKLFDLSFITIGPEGILICRVLLALCVLRLCVISLRY
ncbi:MAG: hypothetical protein U0790_02185 [Isosphaeraceae bacterium]